MLLLRQHLKEHAESINVTVERAISSLKREPTVSITINNDFKNFGTITGNVTIQNTLQEMSSQQGTAEIAKVFADLLGTLQDSKEIGTNHQRRALVGAAEELAEEAAKPPAQRDSSKLKDSWKFLTEAISAAKGLGEIAGNWEKWGAAIKGFFQAGGGPDLSL